MQKNHDYCYIEMPEKVTNIIKYNPGKNSLKVTFVSYADTEPLIGKIDTCHKNKKNINNKRKQTYCLWLFVNYTLLIY